MTERTAEERILTTEWEDVQYRFGNKVGQYIHHESQILHQKEKEIRPESFLAYDPMMEKKITKKLEDSDESDDDLQRIREKMRRNMKTFRSTRTHIEQTDYAGYTRAVTERSKDRNVLLVIHDQAVGHERILDILDALASEELRMISIVSISAREARISLHPRHLPCVVFYSKGTVVDTIYGISDWGGENMDENSALEFILQKGYTEYS